MIFKPNFERDVIDGDGELLGIFVRCDVIQSDACLETREQRFISCQAHLWTAITRQGSRRFHSKTYLRSAVTCKHAELLRFELEMPSMGWKTVLEERILTRASAEPLRSSPVRFEGRGRQQAFIPQNLPGRDSHWALIPSWTSHDHVHSDMDYYNK
jgi:hypothetical protein